MSRGVPVAKMLGIPKVAINNATIAALLAVRMLGVGDVDLQARMSQYLEETKNDVLMKAEKLEKDGWESYFNRQRLVHLCPIYTGFWTSTIEN
ncbi:unnamed protein product [Camellia sinensis]